MATPYFQLRFDTVPSTQDVALEHLEDLPVLVVAAGQSKGRGRLGTEWINADRALAASLALNIDETDHRPFSLVAGVAATRAMEDVLLKWPNDLMVGDLKVGGILVERSGQRAVVGLGVNLYWVDPPEGLGGLYDQDPGEERHAEIAGLWGAEFMALLGEDDWPRDEYRGVCVTLDSEITWQPDGRGRAVDIGTDGGLIVEYPDGETGTIYSGEVSQVRSGS